MIGQPVTRRDDARALRGQTQYLDDIERPRLAHVAFVRSPHAHAAVTAVRAPAGAPGLVSALTGEAIWDRVEPFPIAALDGAAIALEPHPILAPSEVRYVGQPVAAVIAESRALAEDAAELVEVDYQPLAAVVNPRDSDLELLPRSAATGAAKSGRLTIVASGPPEAWEQARPYLDLLARRVTYVGEGDRARLVKICHNLMLGVVAQCMAEVTVLAEKGGVSRADFLEFLNDSVMGSMFTRYKTPAYVNLDFKPTFTPELLLKDFHLGFEAARDLEVAMPLAAATEQIVQGLVGLSGNEVDFAALLDLTARASGLDLQPENAEVDDGLSTLTTSAATAGVPAAR